MMEPATVCPLAFSQCELRRAGYRWGKSEMTAAFWWYLLAGLILGFCLSTVWEWLYFRQRRMRITDRRIAELEQALRSRERDIAVVSLAGAGCNLERDRIPKPRRPARK